MKQSSVIARNSPEFRGNPFPGSPRLMSIISENIRLAMTARHCEERSNEAIHESGNDKQEEEIALSEKIYTLKTVTY